MSDKAYIQYWSGNSCGKSMSQAEHLASLARRFNDRAEIVVYPAKELMRYKEALQKIAKMCPTPNMAVEDHKIANEALE